MNLFRTLIKNLQGAKKRVFLYFIEITVTLILLTSLAVTYRTFGSLDLPVILHEPAIVNIVELRYDRLEMAGYNVTISRDVTWKNIDNPVTFSARLINKDSLFVIDLPRYLVSADELGEFKLKRLYYLSYLNKGNWCLRTTYYWTPTFSLRERAATSAESCFTVN